MPTYAWRGRLLPGREDDYKKRHDAIWPEMVALLKAAGFTRYTIFRDGNTLFACFECADPVVAARHMAASDLRARWSSHMAGILEQDIDPETQFPKLLDLQWELE